MRIILFNHKGGVSKTTTTFNLAWKLAEKGNRVLLIDADSQCNLTGLILGDYFEQYYLENPHNIKDGVSPAFDSKPEPIKAFDCYNVPNNHNLFLLPGHPNLTELEPSLSFAQNSNNAFSTMQNLPGALNALIEALCEHHQIDYVFFDVNPSLGAINQNLFSISDIFIVPTNPDPFSLMAIRTLASVLPRWKSTAIQMRSMFHNSAYPFPERDPQMAGLLIQRFNIRNGQPNAPFRNNMDEILEEVENTLIPSLKKNNMLLDTQAYINNTPPDKYCISEIPDFQSLLQLANNYGVPVFSLSEQQMERTGTVLEQLTKKRDSLNAIFNSFADLIQSFKSYVDR